MYSSADRVSVPPEKRGLSMVFQSHALWPHMTVRDNVGYSLRTSPSHQPKVQVRERVDEIMAVVGLEKYLSSFPGQLSSGQQQRVALARALVANQGVILFDEPLSNLDAKVCGRRAEAGCRRRHQGQSGLFDSKARAQSSSPGDDQGLLGKLSPTAEN